MAADIHINGAALVKVGLQGTGQVDALQVVGITENGPQIEIDFLEEPVIADNAGPQLPADYQQMGKMARISFALPIYDLAVLTTWFLSNQSGSAEGRILAVGTLIFANNKGFRVVLSSPIEGQPWRFFWCKVNSCKIRPGTKYNIYDVSLTAIPYIGAATASANKDLYDHTDG